MIGYAGLTHLGLVSSAAAASKGFDVVAFDPEPDLVARLQTGHMPVVEPGLPEMLDEQSTRITLTADPAALGRCRVVYVSVDVPTDDQHRSDVTPVERLVHLVAGRVAPDTAIVVLSQVPPGFCRTHQAAVEAAGSRLYCQVETLVFGQAVARAVAPERFMVGCPDPAVPLPRALTSFLGAFGCPVLPMRYESAELCKISINMFLVSSVATTNTLAEICEVVGAEWREIAPALRLDRRIGPHAYLSPGLGVGGGNLTRDLATISHLARQYGTEAGVVEAWNANTQHRRNWVLRELHRGVLSRPGPVAIGIWGLTYKENTAVTKSSPALELIARLRDVPVAAFDPAARLDREAVAPWLRIAGSPLEACRDADALAIMTPWPEFSGIDPAALVAVMRGRLLVDPYGIIDAHAAARHGFVHRRLGTGSAR
ncbi:MAG: nucleotide sugar dehydrogenase [Acidobacteriota bacterium]